MPLLRWSLEPTIIGGILLAAGVYVWQVPRSQLLSRTGGLFWLGLLAFAVALLSPLDSAGDHYLLTAHMLQHMAITMIGPPLPLAGLPRTVPLFRGVRWLINPWVGATTFNVVLLVWPLPSLYQATLTNEW